MYRFFILTFYNFIDVGGASCVRKSVAGSGEACVFFPATSGTKLMRDPGVSVMVAMESMLQCDVPQDLSSPRHSKQPVHEGRFCATH